MRKLASIQEIRSIEPIEGADKIELAHVLGWQCVVNKGQFQPGQKAVYFEIDSFLPVREEFEFLRKSGFTTSDLLGEGFRLRTMKFKGQISQGLLLPVETFPELSSNMGIGTNVTELLGVYRYEIAQRVTNEGNMVGVLPDSIPCTDETRVQNEPDLLKEFEGLPYYITSKMDGSSHSIGIDEKGFHVTSHHYEYSDGSFYTFVRTEGYKERLKNYFDEHPDINSIVLQGELCGPGIQANPVKLTHPMWYVFTVIINNKRLGLKEMQELLWELSIPSVPVEEVGDNLIETYPDIESLLKRAGEGTYSTGARKEGIVIRPQIPVHSRILHTDLSMKVINNQYLLKQK